MGIFSKEAADILEKKDKLLESYNQQYTGAVSLVTSTIEHLEELSSNIREDIIDIEEYKEALDVRKNQLEFNLTRSEMVAENFKKLLNVPI